MVKLISEYVDRSVKPIVESVEGQPKKYWLTGTFLQSNVLNKNNRIYPQNTLKSAVEEYTKHYINSRRALSELGHPDQPIVNLDRVAHLVTELKEDGTNWWGKAQVLGTPYGLITQRFIDEGIGLGVSSRGMGSLVEKEGINIVQDDYKIVAIDSVWDPSGPNCLVNGLMESAEWIMDVASGDYKLVEEIQKDIRLSRKKIEETILEAFGKFINNI